MAAESWPAYRATWIAAPETRDEEEMETISLVYRTADYAEETPDCLARLVLIMLGAKLSTLTDGFVVEFLENGKGLGIYDVWCTEEEFDAVVEITREHLLMLN